MASILDELAELPDRRRLELLALACRDALAVWNQFAEREGPITYRDGVVGMLHELDLALPGDALDEIERANRGDLVADDPIEQRYLEPRTALQDDDLGLPATVGLAYLAISNLHRILWDAPGAPGEHVVLDQCAGALGGERDALLREWWVRIWDRWATAPALPYPPRELSDEAFGALEANDLARAAELAGASRIGVTIAGMRGRHDEARELAAIVLGVDRTAARDVISQHDLAPDAIAFGSNGIVALIHRDELVVLEDGVVRWRQGWVDEVPRLVRYNFNMDYIWVCGDVHDRIGPCGSFVDGFQIDGKRIRSFHHAGARAIAALGDVGAIIPQHPDRVLRLHKFGGEELGRERVIAAAISDDGAVITSDGERLFVWDDAGPVATRPVDNPPLAAMWLRYQTLLIGRTHGPATQIELDDWIRG